VKTPVHVTVLALAAAMLFVGADLKVGPYYAYAGQAPQEPTPTFRQGVEAVQLSVIVTDSEGNPVSGLTEDDFEILENGSPRQITTFAAVNIPIERVERTLVEKDVLSNDGPPGRLYVIALDYMTPDNALRARAFLRRFIEQYFGPNDTAAVVLTTAETRESGQEFTSNPRLLLNAIDRFGGGTADGGDWQREKSFTGDFKNLLSYSPYHHVTDGVKYPAVLLTASGNDTRVNPLHARKLCAALQHATAGTRPVLLRFEPDAGHTTGGISLAADMLAFVADQTGLRR